MSNFAPMDFINFHIAYLLTKHEQVIVPDFGAFVVSKAKDDKLSKRGMISPPVKYSLSFDPNIIKNDGLLVNSIAKEKNISDKEALSLVYEYIDSLVDNLRTGQIIRFPWIGKIHLSNDRKIVFTPALNLSCNASNCGLVNFSFPYLNENLKDDSIGRYKKKRNRPVFFVFIALIIMSIILGILVFFIPLDYIKELKELILFSNKPTASDTLIITPPKHVVDSLLFVDVDSTAYDAIDSITLNVIDSVAPDTIDFGQTQPQYFIIIASLTKEKEAEGMLSYFISKGLDNAKIIRSDGKYRISIEHFNKKEEAVTFLNIIKKKYENPLLKDAWILENKKQ